MNKHGLLDHAANFAPGLFQVRRTTWIAIGVGLLVMIGMLIWAAMALIGALLGMGQNAPEAARRALRQVEEVVPGARDRVTQIVPPLTPMVQEVLDRAEALIPDARDKVDEMIPTLKSPALPQRDVSGADLGPVARYPGLARILWQRKGTGTAVEYAGGASYAAVLDHYSKGFAAQGFIGTVESATIDSETHEYTKGSDHIILKIAQKPKGVVSVRLEATRQ